MLANEILTLLCLYLRLWSVGSGERPKMQGTSIAWTVHMTGIVTAMLGATFSFAHAFSYMWFDQAKLVWSWKLWFLVFWHFLLGHYLGFNLVKTPQRLGNWFQSYKQLTNWINNKKQKKLSALFDYIFKKEFASSDSFYLITSHICIILWNRACTTRDFRPWKLHWSWNRNIVSIM